MKRRKRYDWIGLFRFAVTPNVEVKEFPFSLAFEGCITSRETRGHWHTHGRADRNTNAQAPTEADMKAHREM